MGIRRGGGPATEAWGDPDRGRSWQKVANARKRRKNWPPDGAGAGRTGCLAETGRLRPFAKPTRIPPRNRAASPKTILITVPKTVKTSDNRPNFRMVGAFATHFLFAWRRGAPAWHYPGGNPRPATFLPRPVATGLRRDPTRPLRRPLCRGNPLRGARWRTERQNYGAAAQQKPGMCLKCVPSVPQTWPFCSVDYTTARTSPRGACWRVAEAAPPRRRLFEFGSRRRRYPESRRVCGFRHRRYTPAGCRHRCRKVAPCHLQNARSGCWPDTLWLRGRKA
jgi:hypothetical protein